MKWQRAFFTRLGLTALGAPLLAHHGTGMCEMSHPITVTGVDVISCTGGAAKSGAPTMLSSIMKLAGGRELKS